MEDDLEKRKEKVVAFLKQHKQWIVYLLLLGIIWLGADIRSANIPLLKDQTTGETITAELDSTIFLRYAEYIAEHGKLPAVDAMRFVPVGADLSHIGTFTSYFVAYLWKFLHLFNPEITVAYVDIIYPVIAMAVMTIFLFLLVRRIFNEKVALLACLFITLIPTFIFRSTAGSSDHDMLGMMLFVMTLYYYVVAYQARSLKKTLVFGAISAILVFVGRHTAGNANFALFIVGAFTLVSIFLDRFEKKDFYLYALWLGLSMLLLQLSGKFGGVMAFATSVTTGIAFVALLFAIVDFVVFKKDLFKIRQRVEAKMPLWIATLLISLVMGSIIIAVMFGPEYFVVKGKHVLQYVFKAYGETRWTLTVAENRKPFVVDWFSQMGKLFVYFFLLGGVWLFYETVKKLKGAKMLTGIFALFLFGYTFSRYSPDSVFNGTSTLSHLTFYGSLIGFFVLIFYLYIRIFYRDREQYRYIAENVNLTYAFLFIWYIIMVMAATSAIRLLFEFSVITSILAAFFIIAALQFFWERKHKVLRYAGILVIVLILASPFSLGFMSKGMLLTHYQSSDYQAANTGPSYGQQWQLAGKWIRENTPNDAVFIHWWDYGYWVQSGFKRATVTDGGNFFIYWNYLVGRHLLTGDDVTQAFELMKAHKTTHLLVVSDEIGKYGAYSSIGSDLNYDRFASIGIFANNQQRTQETRNQTVFVYEGGVQLYETYTHDGIVF
ncbi:MAG: STT3 domain-containing protein, partial [Nanoarchaeota archaeon]